LDFVFCISCWPITSILKAYATAASPVTFNRGEFMFWVVIVVC
jgi:hypothetical protein